MFDRNTTFHVVANVVNHLSGVDLDGENAFHLRSQFLHGIFGEGPERDGTKKLHFDSFFVSHFNNLLRDTSRRTEGYDAQHGFVGTTDLIAHLVFLNLMIFGLEVEVVLLHDFRAQFD